MSFGFSPGDIVLLGKFLLTVRHALKEEDGSQVQYLRAIKQCNDFDGVLDSIRRLDLSNATESFKEQLAQCAFDTQGVINDFRQTVARYEKSMGDGSSRGKITSAPRKIQWAFNAADDLDDFRKRLQSQVDRIQLALQGNAWEMLAKVYERTQFLDGPSLTSPVLAPRAVSMRRNTWMAGGTVAPLTLEGVYQEIDFIRDLFFRRFFRSEAHPPIREMGRAFTLLDNDSTAVAVTTRPSTNLPPSTESAPGPGKWDTHTPSSAKQSRASAQPPNESAGMDLRDEINERLRSWNLEELSPHEKQQLQTPSSTLQLFLEPPPATESPDSDAQPTTFRKEPSPAGEEGPPPHEKPRKSHRFTTPNFSGSSMDPIATLGIAANILQMVEIAAKLATAYRSLRNNNRELFRLASTLSRVSEVLHMMFEISQTSMSGSIQDLTLRLSAEIQEEVTAAEKLLRQFDPGSSTALARLSKTIKFVVNRQEVENVTQALERLDRKFAFVLQIHQAKMTESFIERMKILEDGIHNLSYEVYQQARHSTE